MVSIIYSLLVYLEIERERDEKTYFISDAFNVILIYFLIFSLLLTIDFLKKCYLEVSMVHGIRAQKSENEGGPRSIPVSSDSVASGGVGCISRSGNECLGSSNLFMGLLLFVVQAPLVLSSLVFSTLVLSISSQNVLENLVL